MMVKPVKLPTMAVERIELPTVEAHRVEVPHDNTPIDGLTRAEADKLYQRIGNYAREDQLPNMEDYAKKSEVTVPKGWQLLWQGDNADMHRDLFTLPDEWQELIFVVGYDHGQWVFCRNFFRLGLENGVKQGDGSQKFTLYTALDFVLRPNRAVYMTYRYSDRLTLRAVYWR